MPNLGRMTSGTLLRQLQYGLDKTIEHVDRAYIGEYQKVFEEVETDKGFYEYLQLAGTGIAAVKNEGDSTTYDTMNQDFGYHQPIITYSKTVRITQEAIDYNLYENLVDRVMKELVKSHKVTDDLNAVYVINSGVTSGQTWGDGVTFINAAHPIYAGTPASGNSNLVSAALSEDAVETAINQIYGFVNPDGLIGDYEGKKLLVPTALQFVAKRIMGSPYRTSTANNDINVIKNDGYIDELIVWRRISSATTWLVLTDADDGLLNVRDKAGYRSKVYQDDATEDTFVYSRKRSSFLLGDWRVACGNIGS